MRRRIILGAPTESGLLNEMRLRLGEVGDDFSTSVSTQAATAVGTGGVKPLAARGDHQHPYLMAPKTLIQQVNMTTSTAGISDYFPRADHVHFLNPGAIIYGAGASNVSLSTSTAGVAANAARGDHVHYLLPATDISNASWSTATAGLQSNVARGDHVHIVPHGVNTQPARTTSVVYTNNGSGPMWVMISLALSLPAADGAHLQVGGVDVAHGDGPVNDHFFIAGIVNPGSSYLLTATGGANIGNWTEYGI